MSRSPLAFLLVLAVVASSASAAVQVSAGLYAAGVVPRATDIEYLGEPSLLVTAADPTFRATDIAYDADNYFVVNDFANGHLYAVQPDRSFDAAVLVGDERDTLATPSSFSRFAPVGSGNATFEQPLGLAYDAQRRLVLAQYSTQQASAPRPSLVRAEQFTTTPDTQLLNEFNTTLLNGPVDAVFRSDGGFYVIDGTSTELPSQAADVVAARLLFIGGSGRDRDRRVLAAPALLQPEAQGGIIINSIAGLALSADQRTLFVVDRRSSPTGFPAVWAMSLNADGTLESTTLRLVFVIDEMTFAVERNETAAEFYDTLPLMGLAVADDGTFFLALGNAVGVFSSSGAPLGAFVPDDSDDYQITGVAIGLRNNEGISSLTPSGLLGFVDGRRVYQAQLLVGPSRYGASNGGASGVGNDWTQLSLGTDDGTTNATEVESWCADGMPMTLSGGFDVHAGAAWLGLFDADSDIDDTEAIIDWQPAFHSARWYFCFPPAAAERRYVVRLHRDYPPNAVTHMWTSAPFAIDCPPSALTEDSRCGDHSNEVRLRRSVNDEALARLDDDGTFLDDGIDGDALFVFPFTKRQTSTVTPFVRVFFSRLRVVGTYTIEMWRSSDTTPLFSLLASIDVSDVSPQAAGEVAVRDFPNVADLSLSAGAPIVVVMRVPEELALVDNLAFSVSLIVPDATARGPYTPVLWELFGDLEVVDEIDSVPIALLPSAVSADDVFEDDDPITLSAHMVCQDENNGVDTAGCVLVWCYWDANESAGDSGTNADGLFATETYCVFTTQQFPNAIDFTSGATTKRDELLSQKRARGNRERRRAGRGQGRGRGNSDTSGQGTSTSTDDDFCAASTTTGGSNNDNALCEVQTSATDSGAACGSDTGSLTAESSGTRGRRRRKRQALLAAATAKRQSASSGDDAFIISVSVDKAKGSLDTAIAFANLAGELDVASFVWNEALGNLELLAGGQIAVDCPSTFADCTRRQVHVSQSAAAPSNGDTELIAVVATLRQLTTTTTTKRNKRQMFGVGNSFQFVCIDKATMSVLINVELEGSAAHVIVQEPSGHVVLSYRDPSNAVVVLVIPDRCASRSTSLLPAQTAITNLGNGATYVRTRMSRNSDNGVQIVATSRQTSQPRSAPCYFNTEGWGVRMAIDAGSGVASVLTTQSLVSESGCGFTIATCGCLTTIVFVSADTGAVTEQPLVTCPVVPTPEPTAQPTPEPTAEPTAVPSFCGDGVTDVGLGEQCDLGALRNSDTLSNTCRTDCQLPSCGDGVVDDGAPFNEVCDAPGDAECVACEWINCGDGVLDEAAGEECDDRNRVSNDGCSSSCVDEGFVAYVLPSRLSDAELSVPVDGVFADERGIVDPVQLIGGGADVVRGTLRVASGATLQAAYDEAVAGGTTPTWTHCFWRTPSFAAGEPTATTRFDALSMIVADDGSGTERFGWEHYFVGDELAPRTRVHGFTSSLDTVNALWGGQAAWLGATAVDGQNAHVCVVLDGSIAAPTLLTYVNGVADPAGAQQLLDPNAVSGINFLMNAADQSVPLTVAVDEQSGIADVRIYTRALSAASILDIFQRTRPRYLVDCVVQATFDNVAAGVHDESGRLLATTSGVRTTIGAGGGVARTGIMLDASEQWTTAENARVLHVSPSSGRVTRSVGAFFIVGGGVAPAAGASATLLSASSASPLASFALVATIAADGRVGYALDGTSTVATYADFSSAPLDATSTVSPVHLGVVFADDGTRTLLRNGVVVASVAATTGNENNVVELDVVVAGFDAPTPAGVAIFFDELTVWDAALSVADMAGVARSGASQTCFALGSLAGTTASVAVTPADAALFHWHFGIAANADFVGAGVSTLNDVSRRTDVYTDIISTCDALAPSGQSLVVECGTSKRRKRAPTDGGAPSDVAGVFFPTTAHTIDAIALEANAAASANRFTLSMWLVLTAETATDAAESGFGALLPDRNGLGVSLTHDSGAFVAATLGTNGRYNWRIDSSCLADNEFNGVSPLFVESSFAGDHVHLALVSDELDVGGGAKQIVYALYRNGVLIAEQRCAAGAVALPPLDASSPGLRVTVGSGRRELPQSTAERGVVRGFVFDHEVSAASLWTSALSAAEVLAVANAGRSAAWHAAFLAPPSTTPAATTIADGTCYAEWLFDSLPDEFDSSAGQDRAGVFITDVVCGASNAGCTEPALSVTDSPAGTLLTGASGTGLQVSAAWGVPAGATAPSAFDLTAAAGRALSVWLSIDAGSSTLSDWLPRYVGGVLTSSGAAESVLSLNTNDIRNQWATAGTWSDDANNAGAFEADGDTELHLVAVFKRTDDLATSTTIKIYRNGVLYAQSTSPTALADRAFAAMKVRFGSAPDTASASEDFEGSLRAFAIYPALDDGEVQFLYQRGAAHRCVQLGAHSQPEPPLSGCRHNEQFDLLGTGRPGQPQYGPIVTFRAAVLEKTPKFGPECRLVDHSGPGGSKRDGFASDSYVAVCPERTYKLTNLLWYYHGAGQDAAGPFPTVPPDTVVGSDALGTVTAAFGIATNPRMAGTAPRHVEIPSDMLNPPLGFRDEESAPGLDSAAEQARTTTAPKPATDAPEPTTTTATSASERAARRLAADLVPTLDDETLDALERLDEVDDVSAHLDTLDDVLRAKIDNAIERAHLAARTAYLRSIGFQGRQDLEHLWEIDLFRDMEFAAALSATAHERQDNDTHARTSKRMPCFFSGGGSRDTEGANAKRAFSSSCWRTFGLQSIARLATLDAKHVPRRLYNRFTLTSSPALMANVSDLSEWHGYFNGHNTTVSYEAYQLAEIVDPSNQNARNVFAPIDADTEYDGWWESRAQITEWAQVEFDKRDVFSSQANKRSPSSSFDFNEHTLCPGAPANLPSFGEKKKRQSSLRGYTLGVYVNLSPWSDSSTRTSGTFQRAPLLTVRSKNDASIKPLRIGYALGAQARFDVGLDRAPTRPHDWSHAEQQSVLHNLTGMTMVWATFAETTDGSTEVKLYWANTKEQAESCGPSAAYTPNTIGEGHDGRQDDCRLTQLDAFTLSGVNLLRQAWVERDIVVDIGHGDDATGTPTFFAGNIEKAYVYNYAAFSSDDLYRITFRHTPLWHFNRVNARSKGNAYEHFHGVLATEFHEKQRPTAVDFWQADWATRSTGTDVPTNPAHWIAEEYGHTLPVPAGGSR